MKTAAAKEIPVRLFSNQKAWATWLAKHHASSSGVWLRIAKKGGNVKSVSYAEALDVALCYGWIDGQKQTFDESTYRQKFTPRGAKSIWSKINRAKAEQLVLGGKMQAAGLNAIERAKQDGRWEKAYESQRTARIPADLQAELDQHPQAQAFYATLNSVNRYAILFRIQTAKKAETRAQRIQKFIQMLEKHEKIHP